MGTYRAGIAAAFFVWALVWIAAVIAIVWIIVHFVTKFW